MNFLVNFKRIITTGLLVGAAFCCASAQGMSSTNQEKLNDKLLDAAAVCDFSRVQDCLMQGASIDAQDGNENTALHIAVLYWNKWDSCLMLKFLLSKKIFVNVQNTYKYTPLHWAVSYFDRGQHVKILVEHGADMYLKNDAGSTAYSVAFSLHPGGDAARYLEQVDNYYTSGIKVPLSQRDALTPNYFILSLLSEKYDDLEVHFDEQVACGKTPNIPHFMERARRLNKVKSLEKLKWLHCTKKYKEHNESIQKKLWQCATSPQFDDVIVNTQGE